MSYTHFNAVERGKIELLHKQGMSTTMIGQEIGRHRTSVGREIRRNASLSGYQAQAAQTRYVERRKVCRPTTRLTNERLRDVVVEKIAEEEWSPELVAGRLRSLYPDDRRMHVCHETIYKAIYSNLHHLDFLMEFLTQARPKRRKRGQGKTRRGPPIANRVSIHERPEEVEQRREIGHWEGDLVVGKNQDGFILTLVERHSRRTAAAKVASRHAEPVAQAVVQTLQDYPVSWVKTITFDNGTEFANHQGMSQKLNASVYFADPYAAYQRGSNEQVNGLLRRYVPKGTSFTKLDQSRLNNIIEKLNNRPRKCLGYQTPNEVFLKQRQEHLRALRP
jgi:IS30 family transposase